MAADMDIQARKPNQWHFCEQIHPSTVVDIPQWQQKWISRPGDPTSGIFASESTRLLLRIPQWEPFSKVYN
jgi:hypothetical protein